MRIEIPFAALHEFLESNNIQSDGVIISLPKRDFHQLSMVAKSDMDMMMRYPVDKNFSQYNEMTIHGIKIKPRYGS